MAIVMADAVLRLVKNRSVREVAPPLSESAPDLTLDQGYAIQRALERALCERGDRVVGWKAGFTNATLQESYGVREPVLGFLLGSGAFSSGDAVPLSRFVSVGLEVEVGFVMGADLAGPGVTASSALLAVAGAIPCFELIDFRLSGKPKGMDVVADGVYANAMVLGGPLTPVQAARSRPGGRGLRGERPADGHGDSGRSDGQSAELARVARQHAGAPGGPAPRGRPGAHRLHLQGLPSQGRRCRPCDLHPHRIRLVPLRVIRVRAPALPASIARAGETAEVVEGPEAFAGKRKLDIQAR